MQAPAQRQHGTLPKVAQKDCGACLKLTTGSLERERVEAQVKVASLAQLDAGKSAVTVQLSCGASPSSLPQGVPFQSICVSKHM